MNTIKRYRPAWVLPYATYTSSPLTLPLFARRNSAFEFNASSTSSLVALCFVSIFDLYLSIQMSSFNHIIGLITIYDDLFIWYSIHVSSAFIHLRLYTDELSDISRKLDIGIDVLLNINEDTKALPDIKNGIDTLNTKFDSFISEQKEHNLWMKEHTTWIKEHNQRLEKILEKLAEK